MGKVWRIIIMGAIVIAGAFAINTNRQNEQNRLREERIFEAKGGDRYIIKDGELCPCRPGACSCNAIEQPHN